MRELARFASIPEAFFARAAEGVDKAEDGEGRILFFARARREPTPMTWDEAALRVRRMAAALIARKMAPGARVALMADNGPLWAMADLAIQAAGGVVVPVYCTSSEATIEHIVTDSEAALFLAGTRRYAERVAPLLDRAGTITSVCLEGDAAGPPGAIDLETFLGPLPDESALMAIDESVAALDRDRIATMIYTSGTTGPPKGVRLSHGNLLANVEASLRICPLTDDDHLLSILPLSHSYERTAGFLAPLLAGATIHFAQSAATLARDIVDARPTMVLVVPRLLEKMRHKIVSSISGLDGIKGRLARRALALRLDAARALAAGRRPGLLARLGAPIALGLIGPSIQARLGGRLRRFFAGGAALSGEVWAFYHAIGVTVIQGYGLTETSPVISCNPLDAIKPGSVGKTLDNLEVTIAGDGEILVRGPSVMAGYHNLPEATAEAIDGEGFFHTGDVGHLDDEGYLFITDRKKDIIVSAAGKNIAPQNVENALCEGAYIEYACVFGEGENVLAAIVSPDVEAVTEFAEREGIDAGDPEALIAHPDVAALFQRAVDEANESLAAYERVARHHLVEVPFSIEGGEITISLKVRRRFVAEKYAGLIETLFGRD